MRYLILFVLCLFLPLQARAEALFDYGRVSLVLEGSERDQGEVKGALLFRLEPGWKVYWRNPGETGFPPRLEWRGEKESTFSWPFPQAFESFGVQNYGYGGEVVLPFRTNRPTALGEKARLDFLVCREVCIPIVEDLAIKFASPSERNLIAASYKRVPQALNEQALATDGGIAKIFYYPIEGERIRIEGTLEGTWVASKGEAPTDVIVEDIEGGIFRLVDVSQKDNLLSFAAEGEFVSQTHRVRLTLSSATGFWQTETDSTLKPFRDNFPLLSSLGLSAPVLLLVFAFLGGLILNLMPCVFPVLALKARAIAAARSEGIAHITPDEARSRLRQHFIASGLGIASAFLVLAAGLLIFKAAGQSVGWGFQFQHPVFVGVISVVLFILALDAFSLLPLPFTPYALQHKRSKLSESKDSFKSEFVGGALIAWIATPCSAPFLGSAISGALASSAPFTLALFAVMGLGMGSPYFLCACFPRQITKLLPRPGRWSQVLRISLGVPILLVALWLFAIFAKQTSPEVAAMLGALALVGAALAIVAHLKARLRWTRLAIALPILGALVLPFSPFAEPTAARTEQETQANTEAEEGEGEDWQEFEPEKIPALLEENTIVLVDITADWCLSCKLNDSRAFNSTRVRERWQNLQPFVRMRGDWTRRDTRIGDFLESYDRYAIPFTILLLEESPPIYLPELFGEETLLEALSYAEALRKLATARANVEECGNDCP